VAQGSRRPLPPATLPPRRNAQMAGRASVELHTLVFFKNRTVVADARVTKVRRSRPAGRPLLPRVRCRARTHRAAGAAARARAVPTAACPCVSRARGPCLGPGAHAHAWLTAAFPVETRAAGALQRPHRICAQVWHRGGRAGGWVGGGGWDGMGLRVARGAMLQYSGSAWLLLSSAENQEWVRCAAPTGPRLPGARGGQRGGRRRRQAGAAGAAGEQLCLRRGEAGAWRDGA
jgi:hypothetical protein